MSNYGVTRASEMNIRKITTSKNSKRIQNIFSETENEKENNGGFSSGKEDIESVPLESILAIDHNKAIKKLTHHRQRIMSAQVGMRSHRDPKPSKSKSIKSFKKILEVTKDQV